MSRTLILTSPGVADPCIRRGENFEIWILGEGGKREMVKQCRSVQATVLGEGQPLGCLNGRLGVVYSNMLHPVQSWQKAMTQRHAMSKGRAH